MESEEVKERLFNFNIKERVNVLKWLEDRGGQGRRVEDLGKKRKLTEIRKKGQKVEENERKSGKGS